MLLRHSAGVLGGIKGGFLFFPWESVLTMVAGLLRENRSG